MNKAYIKSIVLRLRRRRIYHRKIGLFLSIFLLIITITGILLAWKKDADWIQPPSQKSSSKSVEAFQSIASIQTIAKDTMLALKGEEYAKVDRIDVRPSKGIAKVLMKKGYWEVQVDCTSLAVLSIEQRHSDWIEAIHDGSIISDGFKLVSMNIIGVLLILMTLTGLYMYFYPKKVKSLRKTKKN